MCPMRRTTSDLQYGVMHHMTFTTPDYPRELAGLTDRQRSARAAWRFSLREALLNNRLESATRS